MGKPSELAREARQARVHLKCNFKFLKHGIEYISMLQVYGGAINADGWGSTANYAE